MMVFMQGLFFFFRFLVNIDNYISLDIHLKLELELDLEQS